MNRCIGNNLFQTLSGFLLPTIVASAICASENTDGVPDVPLNFDESRLWLPSSLTYLKPDFYRSAEIALSTNRCIEILRGELHTIDPDKTEPIFKFICKGSESLTVATLVDGKKFEVINTAGETKLQQHNRHLNQYGKICQRRLSAKTDRLQGVKWPEGGNMKPSLVDNDRVEYEIDFDAEGFGGETLKYRGYCLFKNLKNYTVDVKPRPKSEAK